MSPPGDDVLAQIHIPKCAGTAVAFWMMRAVNDGGVLGFGSLYQNQGVYDSDSLWKAGLDDLRIGAISSHDVRRFPAEIHGRRMHYFTILRHPLANFLSAVRYMQSDRNHFGVPPSVGSTSREVAEWLLSRPIGQPFRENSQTNHIALYEWCDAAPGRPDPDRYGSWEPAEQALYESERLELAKRLLRTFLVVGTVERLPASLELVRTRIADFGIRLPPVGELGRNNTTTVPLDDIAWLQSESTGKRVLDAITVDWELYRFGEQLLNEALQAGAKDG